MEVNSKLEDEDEDIEEKKVNPAICLQSFFLILTFLISANFGTMLQTLLTTEN